MKPILISIADTANALSICKSKVYQLIAQERLATVRLGRRNLVQIASLEAFMRELTGTVVSTAVVPATLPEVSATGSVPQSSKKKTRKRGVSSPKGVGKGTCRARVRPVRGPKAGASEASPHELP